MKLSKQLKDSYDGDPQVRKLIDTARAIEGMPRNTSTHAAGVVITNRPVVDYVPLATNDGLPVTQYIMKCMFPVLWRLPTDPPRRIGGSASPPARYRVPKMRSPASPRPGMM